MPTLLLLWLGNFFHGNRLKIWVISGEKMIDGKTVLVTGGTGSFGNTVVKKETIRLPEIDHIVQGEGEYPF
jgi:FlaA1/EpsC-like NDP-sugar epimerase